MGLLDFLFGNKKKERERLEQLLLQQEAEAKRRAEEQHRQAEARRRAEEQRKRLEQEAEAKRKTEEQANSMQPFVFNPFSILGQTSLMAYDHHLQGMQMADMLTEPRIARLDPALGNIFNQMYARYSSTPSENIISLGNKYHSQVFGYIKTKVESQDFNF